MDNDIKNKLAEAGKVLEQVAETHKNHREQMNGLLKSLGIEYGENVEDTLDFESDKERFGIFFDQEIGWKMYLWYGPYRSSLENLYFGCYDPKAKYGFIKIYVDCDDNYRWVFSFNDPQYPPSGPVREIGRYEIFEDLEKALLTHWKSTMVFQNNLECDDTVEF